MFPSAKTRPLPQTNHQKELLLFGTAVPKIAQPGNNKLYYSVGLWELYCKLKPSPSVDQPEIQHHWKLYLLFLVFSLFYLKRVIFAWGGDRAGIQSWCPIYNLEW